jgi:hypothetical protein
MLYTVVIDKVKAKDNVSAEVSDAIIAHGDDDKVLVKEVKTTEHIVLYFRDADEVIN